MSITIPIEPDLDVWKPGLCAICQGLDYVVVSFKIFRYGTPKQIRSREECPICKLVLGLLPAESLYDEPDQSSDSLSDQRVILRGLGRPGFLVWHGQIIRGEIGFVYANDGSGSHPRWESPFKELAAGGITKLHLPTLKAWITDCELSHDNCVSGHSEAFDLFLLDVLDNCLVRRTTMVRYITLSYVRGSQPMFELTSADLTALQKPGALLDIVPKLGRVMQDALKVVRGIGERYLWIDALCIPRDGYAEKPRMIMQMDAVYSQGLVTIIALNAESSAFLLPGVQPAMRLRSIAIEKAPENVTASGGPKAYLAIRPGLEELLTKVKYGSRVYFVCMAEDLKSDAVLLPEEHSWKDRMMISKIVPQNSLTVAEQYQVYMLLINTYSRRKLSFSSDSLNAISGVLAVLSKSFGWNFRAGLPDHLLDHALLWRPGDKCHQRNFEFPSWTWVGWTGDVDWWFQSLLETGWNEHHSEPGNLVELRSEIKHLDRFVNSLVDEWRDVLSFEAQVLPAEHFEVVIRTNDAGQHDVRTYSFKEIWLKGSFRCGVLYELSDNQVGIDEPTTPHKFLALSRSKWNADQCISLSMPDADHPFRP